MPDSLVTALIGAGATIVGAAVPHLLRLHASDSRLHASERTAAVLGVWTGQGQDIFIEADQPKLPPFELRVEFRKRGRGFKGSADVIARDYAPDNATIQFEGGFYNDDYLQFSYRSKNAARKQMGVIVLRLSDDATQLKGYYAAFSPRRGVFVMGNVQLLRGLSGNPDS